jgi:hypothetical protein
MARRNKRANDSQVWQRREHRVAKWSAKHGLPATPPSVPASRLKLTDLYTADHDGIRY